MDYEKKYKDALEAASAIYKNMQDGYNFGGMEDLETIFPELQRETEDEIVIGALISGINLFKERGYKGIGGLECDRIIAWLKKQGEQKHAESFKDLWDKAKDSFPGSLNMQSAFVTGYKVAIKERCAQRPEQEWSEEDEKYICAADMFIRESKRSNYGNYSKFDVINWFKSLRPQNRWKPSEEQIEAIRIAGELGTANESWAMEKLKGLYQELKNNKKI